MKILVICSEDYSIGDSPLARTVGDIVSAYKAEGVEVLGFAPLYNKLIGFNEGASPLEQNYVQVGKGTERVQKKDYLIYESKVCGGLFVRADDYFDRDGIYGDFNKNPYNDNHLRFSFLASAALDYCERIDFCPDCIHCHEWSGVAGALAKNAYKDYFKNIPVFLTIHNIKYDCYCNPYDIGAMGLPLEGFSIDGYEFWGKVSLLKAAILYADKVAFTSISYLFHILSTDLQGGMRGFLESCKAKLFGIQNGIDYEKWGGCKNLPKEKKIKKREFREQFGLKDDSSVLIYAHIDLNSLRSSQTISTIIYDILKLNLQLAIEIPKEHSSYSYFAAVAAQHKGKMALLPFAEDDFFQRERMRAADVFFTISLEEPSAVMLLKAFASGALVLTNRRSKRPLIFTIPFSEDAQSCEDKANAFVAEDDSPDLVLNQIRLAAQVFSEDQTSWGRLVSNAGSLRISWRDTVEHYLLLLQRG